MDHLSTPKELPILYQQFDALDSIFSSFLIVPRIFTNQDMESNVHSLKVGLLPEKVTSYFFWLNRCLEPLKLANKSPLKLMGLSWNYYKFGASPLLMGRN